MWPAKLSSIEDIDIIEVPDLTLSFELDPSIRIAPALIIAFLGAFH